MKQRPSTTLLNFFGPPKSVTTQSKKLNVHLENSADRKDNKNDSRITLPSHTLLVKGCHTERTDLPIPFAENVSFDSSHGDYGLGHRFSKRRRHSILRGDESDEEKQKSPQVSQKSYQLQERFRLNDAECGKDSNLLKHTTCAAVQDVLCSKTPLASSHDENLLTLETNVSRGSSKSDEEVLSENLPRESDSQGKTPAWRYSLDDPLLLNDVTLSNSQHSGLSGQDDPTPIPIPRKSLSATFLSTSLSPPTSFREAYSARVSEARIDGPKSPFENPNNIESLSIKKTQGKPLSQVSTKHGNESQKQPSVETFFLSKSQSSSSPLTHGASESNQEPLFSNSPSFQSQVISLNSSKNVLDKAVGIPKANATGSLFGAVLTTEKLLRSDDMMSPYFDPSCFSIKESKEERNACKPFSSKFSYVANIFNALENFKGSGSGSKKKALLTLTNLYRFILWYSPDDVIPLSYICLNRVAPLYMNVELGVGESLLLKTLTEVYGRSEKSLKTDLVKYEDLGHVAELCRSKMRILLKPPSLTIRYLFTELKNLSDISGQVAQTKKKDRLKRLLVAAESCEAKYIIRFLQGKMRMGIQAATVYQALAYAFSLTCPGNKDSQGKTRCSDTRHESLHRLDTNNVEKDLVAMDSAVRAAISQTSNIELIINALFKGISASDLERFCTIQPGTPVQPMLAKPTKGIGEILQKFCACEYTCEYKYDGERAQIHLKSDGSIALFSRNLETITEKYPDVIQTIKSCFKTEVTECILDSEVVAFDREAQRILSFQILSTRKKKKVEVAHDTHVSVCLFLFDCIQFNGISLLKYPLVERREYLKKVVTELPGYVAFAREMSNFEDVDAFLQEALDAKCEGLMIKTLKEAATYEPAKRSSSWLKLKKDYLENLTDSFDLVLMGAYFGRGKRCKVYGAFLLGCFNEEEETFETICKTGTGFSDEVLENFYQQFQDSILTTKHTAYNVNEKMYPDVWFEPRYVWEIRAADLSISPVHTASLGLKHMCKGIALRFPRFIRVREDKYPEQATSAVQINEIYENQSCLQRKPPYESVLEKGDLDTDDY